MYTYYGMIGCVAFVLVTTCADALLDLVVCVCVCVPFSDLYLFKIRIGTRSSLIIVCTNSVFPFLFYFQLAWR